jgi:hypothetical protein
MRDQQPEITRDDALWLGALAPIERRCESSTWEQTICGSSFGARWLRISAGET